MTPCGMNHVTPTMIRNGQMNIGDKIVLGNEVPLAAPLPSSSELPANAAEAVQVAGEAPSEMQVKPTAATYIDSAVEARAATEAAAETSALAAVSSAELPEAKEVSAAAEDSETVAAAAMTQLSEAGSAASELQPLSYGMGNVERNADSVQNAQSSQNSQGTQVGNGMQPWQSNPDAHSTLTPPSWPNHPDPVYYDGENRNFITYPRMTDYFQDSVNIDETSNTPNFTVPSNPMTPPEYTQTLDYDSVQYMNGFLRTQIGRFVRLEQLVGSNTIEDREGFLVGASNNYVVLQEIGTGNIMTFDLFSIKFVYIYYEDIPRPEPRT